jgi:hypothetical protein
MYLDYVLYLTLNSESTDPRDKIYGNLGLLHNSIKRRRQIGNESLRTRDISGEPAIHKFISKESIIVEYRKSVADVFTEATHFEIRNTTHETDSLNILSLLVGRFGTKVPDLPSWVPNYTQMPTNSLTGMTKVGNWQEANFNYNAAAGRKFRIFQDPHPRKRSRLRVCDGIRSAQFPSIVQKTPQWSNVAQNGSRWR